MEKYSIRQEHVMNHFDLFLESNVPKMAAVSSFVSRFHGEIGLLFQSSDSRMERRNFPNVPWPKSQTHLRTGLCIQRSWIFWGENQKF